MTLPVVRVVKTVSAIIKILFSKERLFKLLSMLSSYDTLREADEKQALKASLILSDPLQLKGYINLPQELPIPLSLNTEAIHPPLHFIFN